MSNSEIQTFQIEITRLVKGQPPGKRLWTLCARSDDLDKLEDAISFIARVSIDAIAVSSSVGKTAGEQK